MPLPFLPVRPPPTVERRQPPPITAPVPDRRTKAFLSILDKMSFKEKEMLTLEFRNLLDNIPAMENGVGYPMEGDWASIFKSTSIGTNRPGWSTYATGQVNDTNLLHEGLHAWNASRYFDPEAQLAGTSPRLRNELYTRYWGTPMPPSGAAPFNKNEQYATAGERGPAGVPPELESAFADTFRRTIRTARRSTSIPSTRKATRA